MSELLAQIGSEEYEKYLSIAPEVSFYNIKVRDMTEDDRVVLIGFLIDHYIKPYYKDLSWDTDKE